MAEVVVFTYQDMVNRLLDGPFGELERDGRNHRLARRAVLRAYRDLPTMHKWSYYERIGKINTTAPQTTGTIAYDHTGHASGERIVTLSGATWPTDAFLYDLLISNQIYDVSRYIDTTHIQLSSVNNPGADITSGTSYTLFNSLYPAPIGMRRCSDPIDISRSYILQPVSAAEMLAEKANNYTPSQEISYTVRNADNYYGSLVFELNPPPVAARTYDYVYEAAPRQLKTEKYSTGTVSISAGSTTVTGSGTTFSSDHIGGIIRFSADGTNEPSSLEGSLEVDNPYVAQRSIMQVDSTTSLEVDSAVSSTTGYSAVKYTISDPVDVEPYSMLSALEKLAVAYYAEELGRIPREEIATWYSQFRRELVVAMNADNQQRDGLVAPPDRRFYSLRDWAIAQAYGGTVIT